MISDLNRALALAKGVMRRVQPQVAALRKSVEVLPIDVRRQAVAVQEELDLLHHCLETETLRQLTGPLTSPVQHKKKPANAVRSHKTR